jgi:cytochrome c oxidase subunit 2
MMMLMTRTFYSALTVSILLVLAGLMVALPTTSRAEEAAVAVPAAVAAPQAEVPVAEEKPLTEEEKNAAIADAETVSAFDAEKVVGAPVDWQIYFQEAATPIKKTMKPLHDAVQIVITLIVIFVLALMLYIVLRFNKRANPKPQTFTHNKTIEVIWTVIPILILVGIAIPSIRIHYNYYYNEQALTDPDMTIKVVGHQWYWSYEYPDQGIAFDSNITKDEDLPEGAPRLLEVDNPLVVPVGKVVRVQLTAADVMHAWAVPSFGVKKGAIPGRLNETWFKAEKEGIYYGQCSILCGKLHGYMPIKVVVVSEEAFERWVKGAKLKFAANDSFQFAALN